MQDFNELLRDFNLRPDFRLVTDDDNQFGGF